MLSSSISPNEFRVLLPEAIWLESHHFEQARELSYGSSNEALQWQTYVNALAFLGFTQWLAEKMPEQANRLGHSLSAPPAANFIEGACQFCLGEFKFCLIAVEHVLDEAINIPQEAISNPKLAAHFYVALEVCQEEEQIIFRGMMQYDQLTDYLRQRDGLSRSEGCSIPLAHFDPEPNHLLSYCRYLDAIALPLPAPEIESEVAPSTSRTDLRETLQNARTYLSQWLNDTVEDGWQAIETLIHPEAYLALNTRNSEANVRKGKLLNLGVRLGQQSVALLVTISPEPEEKLNVLVQLHPTGGQRFLPPHIQLTLQSKAGEILQEVQARGQDNYIQLQPFKGSAGKRFSLKVSLLGMSVKEDFEL
jgi:Protein of unknown function (DUF1822)